VVGVERGPTIVLSRDSSSEQWFGLIACQMKPTNVVAPRRLEIKASDLRKWSACGWSKAASRHFEPTLVRLGPRRLVLETTLVE